LASTLEFTPHNQRREITPDNPVLLVTGDGLSLPDDLHRFLEWKIDHDAMAVGRSINLYPGEVKHWANVDCEECKHWAENLRGAPIRHTMGDYPWFDIDWGIENCELHPDDIFWHGSSGLFAAYIGLAMGYEKIVLAGCPLDKNGHWYWEGLEENTGPNWKDEDYTSWLEFAHEEKAQKVKSMSGFTAKVLGVPTPDWLCTK